MTFLLALFARPFGARFARSLMIAAGVLLLGLAVLTWFKVHDRRVIKQHEARQEAVNAKADRKADATAAVERRADDAREATERTAIKEAVNEANRTGADPRAAYHRCVLAQQTARKRGERAPGC